MFDWLAEEPNIVRDSGIGCGWLGALFLTMPRDKSSNLSYQIRGLITLKRVNLNTPPLVILKLFAEIVNS